MEPVNGDESNLRLFLLYIYYIESIAEMLKSF
jgi:hypothetical protein